MQPLSLCTTTYGHTHEAWLTALTVTARNTNYTESPTARERQPPAGSVQLYQHQLQPRMLHKRSVRLLLVRTSFLRALDASNTRGTN